MAGDWIKLRKSIWDDPRVRLMSKTLRTSRGQVVGALYRFWSLADDYAADDGTLAHYSTAEIDEVVELPGFGGALPADWCVPQSDGLLLPEYGLHNGQTAKKRSEDTKRKRADRAAEEAKRVREMSEKDRTEVGPEKRREEKNSLSKKEHIANEPAPASKGKKSKKYKLPKADPLSDVWRDRFYPEGVPKSQGSKFGLELKTLRELSATPEQVAIRAGNYQIQFDGAALTASALVKHWQICVSGPTKPKPEPVNMDRFYGPDGELKL